MWKKINEVRRFFRISWLKTIIVNFSMLPFKDACKFPILVSRNVHLFSLDGSINLKSPAKFGMIRFGFFNEDFVVSNKNGIQLCIDGKLTLGNYVRFASGVTLRVYPSGILTIDDNTALGFGTKVFCMDEITINSNTRIGFEVIITDTTFHYMRDINTQKIYDLTSKVVIGSHNWIGARSYIMKGTYLPNYTIVSAGSFCNKKFEKEYILIAGSPVTIKREGIYRCLDKEEDEIKALINKKI